MYVVPNFVETIVIGEVACGLLPNQLLLISVFVVLTTGDKVPILHAGGSRECSEVHYDQHISGARQRISLSQCK